MSLSQEVLFDHRTNFICIKHKIFYNKNDLTVCVISVFIYIKLMLKLQTNLHKIYDFFLYR